MYIAIEAVRASPGAEAGYLLLDIHKPAGGLHFSQARECPALLL